MIRVNLNSKIMIWFNENFTKNQVQFPLPSSEGEETMINRIQKIYGKYLSDEYKVWSVSNFKDI